MVLESVQTEVQTALSKHSLSLNVELVPIPSDNDWGTADSLRYLVSQEKVKCDIILVSCDLFTSSNIDELLHTFRKHKASFTALFFPPSDDLTASDPVPGLKSKYKPGMDWYERNF